MEKINSIILELRERVLALPTSRSGKRMGISLELRTAILSAQSLSGLKSESFCKEVGISYSCLAKWKKDLNPKNKPPSLKGGFKKVEIHCVSDSEQTQSKSKGWIIEGPHGLRISGLSVSELSSLWRSLC
jgi:hypothetical protein